VQYYQPCNSVIIFLNLNK
jgi:hypothetical protein